MKDHMQDQVQVERREDGRLGEQDSDHELDHELDHERYVAQRLDHCLPLVTEDWLCVEQIINRLSEFAPSDLLFELSNSIAVYVDDQAKRGYMLGQNDIFAEFSRKAA